MDLLSPILKKGYMYESGDYRGKALIPVVNNIMND